jgi:2-(1,2-epoxy-1,2-dihydrophenyl)acetyl-CoA isomerase
VTSIEQALWLERDGPVATITFNRPQALNAIDRAVADRLAASLKTVERDDEIRVIVITGAGRAFSAGQDLEELHRDERERGPAALREELTERYDPIIMRLRSIEKPVIAAINGVVTGAGLGIALACDMRIAADDAQFVLSPMAIGLIPAAGMTAFLPLHLGLAKASELAFLGRRIGAVEAKELGIVNEVVPAASLMGAANGLAAHLVEQSPTAIALTKRAFNHWLLDRLPAQLAYEAELQELAAESKEHKDRLQTMIERMRAKESRA